MRQFKCKRCGKCCYPNIFVTLADIHRIAKHFKISDKQAFDRYVSKSIPKNVKLFVLKKNKDKACIFLTKNITCSIYKARPTTCMFYTCDRSKQSKDLFSESKNKQRHLWEYSRSAELTRMYIKKIKTRWSGDSVKACLNYKANNIL